jgi:glycosyltransferase involved in cell wall biosynthesis
MKIFYDARYIRLDFHDGISRYSTELAKALLAILPESDSVTFIVSDVRQRDLIDPNAAYIEAPAPALATEPGMAKRINQYRPDVVFSPLQTFGAKGRTFKLVLTQHDMIYYHYRTPPRNLSPLLRLGWFLYHVTYAPQRAALNSTDLVATVSRTTQRDFERTKLTNRPIVVIPNAPQDLKKYAGVTTHGDVPKNIVYMGSFMPYKNVETLIKGMGWLPGRTLHLMSKITAKRRAQFDAITPEGTDIVYHDGVSDETYARVLADNAVLATASLYEGFGIPVAEALAMGVPAVVSDMPIFHEVAGDGASYFDPKDPKAFAEAVTSLDDESVRNALIAKGKAHVAGFTWETSARTLLNALRSLV